MRKHFLILMLLALLPLAGWAAAGDITTPPTAKKLFKTASAQQLVNAGALAEGSTGWTIRYILSNDDNAPAWNETDWKETIPTGTDAGSYKVWYIAYDGTNAPLVSGAHSVTTTITDVTSAPTAANAGTLAWTGAAQPLAIGGELTSTEWDYYYIVKDGASAPAFATSGDGAWSTAIPTATDPGTYKVWYVAYNGGDINVDSNFASNNSFSVTINSNINIDEAPTLNNDVDYDGTDKQVIKTSGTASSPQAGALTFWYAINTTNAAPAANTELVTNWYTSIADAKLKVKNAGTYYGFYKVVSADATPLVFGPTAIEEGGVAATFVISKIPASITTAPTAKTGLKYKKTGNELVNAGAAVGGVLKYSTDNSTWSEDVPLRYDAADYTVYYKVFGDENHDDYQPQATTAPFAHIYVPVTIAKKNVKAKIETLAANKTIYGVLDKNEVLAISYDGFEDGDNAGNVFDDITYFAPTASFASGVVADGNLATIGGVKKYIKAGTYPEGLQVTGGNAKNYEIVGLNNALVVAPAKVKINLNNKPANATFGTTQTGTTVYADAATTSANSTEWVIEYAKTHTAGHDANYYLDVKVQNGINVDGPTYTDLAYADYAAYFQTRQTGTTTKVTHFNTDVKISRTNTSAAVGEYLLTLSGLAANAITGQTEVVSETNTGLKKFQIVEAALVIKATNKFKTYGVNDSEVKTQAGKWAWTVTAGGQAYNGLSDPQKDAIDEALTREAGETVGDYSIYFPTTLKENELFNNGNYDITWTNGWLVIEKADLTITAKPQTLYVGNKVDKLVQTDYEIDGLVNNPTLSIADAANVSLDFGTTTSGTETAVPVSAVAGHVGELTDDGDYPFGIKVVLANKDALAENYNLIITNGALKVIDTDAGIVLNFAVDNTEALASAAGKTIEVTFGNKTMVKDNWHTMVLPFATTPLELSKLLDQYVVVNRLSDNSTEDHVAFELELNEIPAGEAFLIKSGADIVWDGRQFLTGVLGKKEISKDIVAESKGGNKLVGVYATTSIQSTNDQMLSWLGNTAQKKDDGVTPRENKWYEPFTNPKNIAPFEAYLMYAPNVAARPMITVQDADGTVTAINEVKAGEFQAVKADGWYTINGVKLNGAPTEKGIYINNGKKIVVK